MADLIVVAGTDTGIGKTWVTTALAAAARARGIDVRAIKLVETGTPETPSPDEDGVRLAVAAGQRAPVAALRRYRLPAAAAEAAEREGKVLDLDAALDETAAFARDAEWTLVEGAGGLLSPITWERSLLDVAKTLDARVLLVAADRLGTLNHTLLTLHALETAGVPCVGVVMNLLPEHAGDDATRGANARQLARTRPGLRIVETAQPGWEASLLPR